MSKDLGVSILGNPQGAEVFGLESLDKQYATGFYKLIMQWVKCLLTEYGSSVSDPKYGTRFTSLLTANASALGVTALLNDTVSAATTQIRNRQLNTNIMAEEKLAGTRIVEILGLSADVYTIKVEITNAAGSTLAVVLPSNLSST